LGTVDQLVQQARDGSREAFAELVRRYRGLVFATCFQRTGNLDDSEDLTQEVFVEAHRSLASLREPEKLAAWLRGIAENLCRMHLRRQPPPSVAEEAAEAQADAQASVAKSVELQMLVQQALDGVSARSREVLSLKYVGGYSYAEIAALCELPEKTVRSRLHEGREQLKSQLLRIVAELCECRHGGDETVHCVLDRCGGEPCACVDRLRGE